MNLLPTAVETPTLLDVNKRLELMDTFSKLKVSYFATWPPSLAVVVWAAIFGGFTQLTTSAGKTYNRSRTAKTNLRLFRIGDYTYLEQNPEKDSIYGKQAKEGNRIMWVLSSKGKYVARVWNGLLERL